MKPRSEGSPGGVCAYCDGRGPFTKEHLWPASLHRRFVEDATARPYFFLERAPQKFVVGDPVVKDVCAVCNNGALSRLDTYACELYDRFWHRRIERQDSVVFEYEYDRLLRWVMKMTFNSARVHGSDTGILGYYRRYVIGEFKRPRNVRLFLDLISPSVATSQEEAMTEGEVKAGTKFYPDLLRVGRIAFPHHQVDGVTGRTVVVNAFAFALFVGDRNAPEGCMRGLEGAFAAAGAGAKALPCDAERVEVTASGLNANEALAGHYAAHRHYGERLRAFESRLYGD